MTIFNSLGSNYSLRSALRILFSFGSQNTHRELTTYLEKRYGGKAILVYKGREALEMALRMLPRGHIAINGYTCLALYDAVVAAGHMPLYLDIAENGMNFTAERLQKYGNIRAVVIQNTLGDPCDIAGIAAICRQRGITLVEDLAHSIGATYADGSEAGVLGDLTVLSFSQDKVVDAVAGGALIVRRGNYALEQPTRAMRFSQQCKDRLYPMLTYKVRMAYRFGIGRPYHRLLRALRILSAPFGEKNEGAHALSGWYCSNILRQFRTLDTAAAHRRAVARIYADSLDRSVQLHVDIGRSANLRFPIAVADREGLITRLRESGVHLSDIWYDAPIAPKKYARGDYVPGTCPNAERLSQRMVNLPTHRNVSARDAYAIANIVQKFAAERAEYEVRPVDDRETWESFLEKVRPHSFLQSFAWSQANEAMGSKTYRVGAYQGRSLVATALFIEVHARRGSFLLCPHGPTATAPEALPLLLGHAAQIARNARLDFIRVCPIDADTKENLARYRSLGYRDAPIHMHPELAWMLDITKGDAELLREMRKTTRYLIKKMQNEGVEISVSTDPDDIEIFWPVHQETAKRQRFTTFKKKDLRKEFELFAKQDGAAFFFGKQHGRVVAAAIIVFYNGQAFYHHSGSVPSGSNVSYLLQWRVVQEARRRGCTLYNFWGISPADRPEHPWAGLSLFKKGFGGFAESYIHAQDLPLTNKYWMNWLVESTRRIKRGL